MVQPLPANLLTGTVAHRLLYIITLFIGTQGINPNQNRILVLSLELRLAVNRPGKIPVIGAVLYGNNTTGRHLSFPWISLTNIDNMLYNLFIGGCHGSTHPVCSLKVITEIVRVAEFSVLCLFCNVFPQIPGFARAVFHCGKIGRMCLIPIAGSIGTTAVGDKYQIILHQVDGLLCAILYIDNLFCHLFLPDGFYNYILYIHTELNLYTVGLQIFYQRHNHTFILIVFCKTQCAEIR